MKEPIDRIEFSTQELERFWSKIDKRGPDDCWLWTSYVFASGGYGAFKFSGRDTAMRANRVMWMIVRGGIPEGFCVCHSCDVPACVNPNHLWLGTRGDNNRDMTSKKRNKFRKGEQVDFAKLTTGQIREIRTMRSDGIPMPELAQCYGVSPQHIGRICRRINWKHC